MKACIAICAMAMVMALIPPVETATVIGWGPCFLLASAACMAAAGLLGPVTAACEAEAAAACACFDVETTVQTVNGTKLLAHMKAGDEVLTLDEDHKPTYTRIVANPYMPGNFSFRTIGFDNKVGSVTVTDKHPVCLSGSRRCQPIESGSLGPGHFLLAVGGEERVASVTSSQRWGKYALWTESCTVLASGVLSGTVCEDASKWAATADGKSNTQIV